MKSFPDRVRQAMRQAGLTTSQLDRLMGWVTGTTRNDLFTGWQPLDQLPKLAEILDVNLLWLGSGAMSPEAARAVAKVRASASGYAHRVSAEDLEKIIEVMETL